MLPIFEIMRSSSFVMKFSSSGNIAALFDSEIRTKKSSVFPSWISFTVGKLTKMASPSVLYGLSIGSTVISAALQFGFVTY